MQRLLFSIFVLVPSVLQAVNSEKEITKDVTNELLNLEVSSNQSNQKQLQFKRTDVSLEDQLKQMYGLNLTNKKDDIVIDFNDKEKRKTRGGLGLEGLEKVLDLTKLKNEKPEIGAILDIVGLVAKQNQTNSENNQKKVDAIQKNQESYTPTVVRESTNTVRSIVQVGIVIAVYVIVEIIKQYTTKTA